MTARRWLARRLAILITTYLPARRETRDGNCQLGGQCGVRMGVVGRHRIATEMLSHTTSQLFMAESTLDSLSPLRARLHQSNA